MEVLRRKLDGTAGAGGRFVCRACLVELVVPESGKVCCPCGRAWVRRLPDVVDEMIVFAGNIQTAGVIEVE